MSQNLFEITMLEIIFVVGFYACVAHSAIWSYQNPDWILIQALREVGECYPYWKNTGNF